MDPIKSEFNKHHNNHILLNDYHAEHSHIPFETRMHITCNILGMVKGWARIENRILTLEECRAHIEKFNRNGWQYAVIEKLPAASKNIPRLQVPWTYKAFSMGELEKLQHENFIWIDELKSVKFYMDCILKHKNAVIDVWQEICNKYDSRFKIIADRIQNHDLDKFRQDRIRAFAAYYLHFDRSIIDEPERRPESELEKEEAFVFKCHNVEPDLDNPDVCKIESP